ncbi:MAG: ArsA family ATPase [Synechococcales bacterium]|nr:ArsA family ATPase [Synechococcales bacterium]
MVAHPPLNPSPQTNSLPAKTGLQDYHALHLAMFSGKGGVGKTTLSCGFARYWAQQFPGDRILLISTDPAHSLGDVLQLAVDDAPRPAPDLPNLHIRALDAQTLLQDFKARYGRVLELLVERGSFVEGSDLSPVWDLSWPGLDELMGILEIQRLLREKVADRVVVDMAPSGHTLNLFSLMDFLDRLLDSLDLFQAKHREISQRLTGQYNDDDADAFLVEVRRDLAAGRSLLQDREQTACLVVAIAEPMSLLETQRFVEALGQLGIPTGGILVNRILNAQTFGNDWSQAMSPVQLHRFAEQQETLGKFLQMGVRPVFCVPKQGAEPVGAAALDTVIRQAVVVDAAQHQSFEVPQGRVTFPDRVPPGFVDFVQAGRQLIIVGGKGGVGKTTVSAAIAWGMAHRHPDRNVRVISIDPAHSLGDAFGLTLSHEPQAIAPNLSGQEIEAEVVLDQFRDDYLWELAEMMSGDIGEDAIQLAYGPEAWRQIVAQSLPGIDEMLSLLSIMELLEKKEQDLIILDTAPTGHLLRFLDMPTALGDWLAWIFKLWLKYQDVVGRVELMGRLRTLRKRVVDAQKKLKDPAHTEFIGVLQNQSAIIAEAERLSQSVTKMGVCQRYVVQNLYEPGSDAPGDRFPQQTIVRLPLLPRAIAPLEQIQGAATLLFE